MANALLKASVLPAGSVPPVGALSKGKQTLKIIKSESDGGRDKDVEVTNKETGEKEILAATEFGERTYVYVEFPDGFVKTFQAKKLEDLVAQLSTTLRGRFGLEEVNYTKTPPSLDQGEVIEIDVAA